ncbi:MAG: carboxypeptidase-like regulatory domain-containing protein [Planctomycetota bacterium]|nr:carboxypeptidase-like regulatory domain-containing protein [Planctomycetota bacterium]
MGRIVGKILGALALLALAAAIGFIYYSMFGSGSNDNSSEPDNSDIHGMRISDAPSVSDSRLPETSEPAAVSTTQQHNRVFGQARHFERDNPMGDIPLELVADESNYYDETVTNADGEFSFDDIPPDAGNTFTLRSLSENYYMPDTRVAVNEQITIRPVEAGILQGHVSDSATLMPVQDVRIVAIISWDNDQYEYMATSDYRGDYRIPSLPPGRVTSLVAFASGYVPQEHISDRTILRLNRNSSVRHNIELVAGSPVSGEVKDSNGKPVVGATVFLAQKGLAYDSPRNRALRETFAYLAITDDNGAFSLPPAPTEGEEYEVVVFAEGYAIAKKTFENEKLSFALEEGTDEYPIP